MAARPPVLAVPKSLYKHFAVITVVITLCVAMFADGNERSEMPARAAAHEAAKTGETRQAPATGPVLGGLHDKRGGATGYVVNNNPDVGPMPGGMVAPMVVTVDAASELDEASRLSRPTHEPPAGARRRLPPVLPPGMTPLPGMPGSEDPAAISQESPA